MNTPTRRLRLAGAALLLGLLMPAAGHADDAGRLDLSSSGNAKCIGLDGSCNVVEFELSLEGGDYWVNYIRLRALDWGPWSFAPLGNPVEVRDGSGTVLEGWELMTQYSNEFTLKTRGQIGMDPIYLVVNMDRWGTNTEFAWLRYDGRGCLSEDCLATVVNPETGKLTNQVAFEGTVTPEPVTMVLLGSGLLGVAGAARRRKEQEQEDAEA